ncbi:endonuclease/exonuclease/phosphatase family protein [Roseomonas sp. NAR14]|uniref:Endonuclease/exonuclease/phosphatase family protein n=1 Tax=Roseomonas acroporae TaxID=2937791 RepID=A0A9X2BZV5_9PROT|nr:endonuclease/exonuclease/phosphatase family protein [Roseomonas acroporae]MCK8787470.1 endonuclease/exonuclease/phosphatase family protein [Roseomonas acroporae]
MRLPPLLLALLLLALPARAAEIKLATWNLAWLTLRPAGDPALPPDLPHRRPEDFAALRAYADRLDADVVAFQEVDGPEAAALVFDPARYALLLADEADVQRTGFAIRRALRVTRHPDLAALDLLPDSRGSLRRGTDVTVESGTASLRLLAVHLKSGCRDGSLAGRAPLPRECDLLARQVPVLAGWIAARQAEGAAFAVLGDFNRRMSPPEAMLPALTRAAPLARATEGRSDPCRDGAPFIDHLLLGGAARDWLVPGSLRVLVYAERDPAARERLSDHCPVSIRLRLP